MSWTTSRARLHRWTQPLLVCRLIESGRVAQLVEQCPFKAWVAGSSPAALTMISILYRHTPRKLAFSCVFAFFASSATTASDLGFSALRFHLLPFLLRLARLLRP